MDDESGESMEPMEEATTTVIHGAFVLFTFAETKVEAIWFDTLVSRLAYRERKCADTIGTVPVPRAGHLQ